MSVFCRHRLVWLAAMAAFTAVTAAQAQVTVLIGGSTRNGDFNADTSPDDQRTFADTPNWENIGTGTQETTATRTNLDFNGTRNAQLNEGFGVVTGQDTAYSLVDGDIFNVSYVWRDAFNWDDASDQIGVSLFTTDDDTLFGTRSNLATSLSGVSTTNSTYELVQDNGFFTAGEAEAGRNLFVEINGVDGNGDPNGFARLDNFELSIGMVDPPDPPGDPKPPSPLTGVNLFSDTFDRPDSFGLAVDESTDGMSSDVFTPVRFTTYGEFQGGSASEIEAVTQGNKMLLALGPGQSYAGIDRNFVDQEILDAGGFAIETIVDPRTGANGTLDNRYAAIGVGLTQAAATSQTSNDVDGSQPDRQILEQAALAFTVEDDGQYNLFDSWAIENGASPATPANITNATHDAESKIDDGVNPGQTSFLEQIGVTVVQDEYKLRLEFSFDDFNDGSDAVVTAFIQDVQIDLDPSNGIEPNPEDRDTYTFAWDGTDQNYIAFAGRAQESTSFDFLMIESLVASPSLTGDYNASGQVEQGDLDLVLLNWGSDGSTPPNGWVNDLPDGQIDQAELDKVLLNWGSSGEAATEAVPEPSSLWLLACGALVALGRARRRQ